MPKPSARSLSRPDADVSVVIPAYNAGKFLADAIESVLDQTLRPAEIVVVDDGSSDNTAAIARQYAPEITYVYRENGGPAAARNTGLRNSSGRLIAFLDADDTWERSKLERQLKYLEDNQHCAAVYSDFSEVDVTGTIIQDSKLSGRPGAGSEGWILDKILLCGFIFVQTVVFRRWAFDAVGLFDEELSPSDDRDMMIRVAARFEVGCVHEALLKRRRHDANISNRFMDVGLRTDCRVLEKALSSIPMDVDLVTRVRRHLASLYLRLGRYDLGLGEGGKARKEFRRALALSGLRGELGFLLLPLTFLPGALLRSLNAARARVRGHRGVGPIR